MRIGGIFTQGLVGLGNRGGVQGHLHLPAPFKRRLNSFDGHWCLPETAAKPVAHIISTCGLIHLLPELGTLYHVDFWFHGTLAFLVIINPLTKLSLRLPVLGSSRGACWITLATWTKPPGHIPQDRARSIILATWAPCDAIPTSSAEFNGMAFRSTWHEAPQTAQNMARRDHRSNWLDEPHDFDQSRGHKRPTSLPTLQGTNFQTSAAKKACSSTGGASENSLGG